MPPFPPGLLPDARQLVMTREALVAEGLTDSEILYLEEVRAFQQKLESRGIRGQIKASGLDERVLFVIHQQHTESEFMTERGAKYRELLADRKPKRKLQAQSRILKEAASTLRDLARFKVPFDVTSWFRSLAGGHSHQHTISRLPILDAPQGKLTIPTRSEAACVSTSSETAA